MAIAQMWTLRAADLWSMGYPKCEPEAPPVPMTAVVVNRRRQDTTRARTIRSAAACRSSLDGAPPTRSANDWTATRIKCRRLTSCLRRSAERFARSTMR
jgi:hypothetical protein